MADLVLVAGANLGGWAWERVTPELVANGHDVHPLTLTGFGDRAHLASPQVTLSTHIADIVASIETADLHDVVLVAHSYAGAPAGIAASRVAARIARLVYIAAAVPRPGMSAFDAGGPEFERGVRQAADAAGDGWLVPMMSDEILDTAFGDHGLTAEDNAWMRARGAGMPIGCFTEPAPDDLSALDTLPRTYVVCEGDPGEPLVTPGTPGWDVVSVATGHWPMVTAPAELAAVIDKAARI
jgi:pimeloyl-ACP methyl ester carboxylesterase